MPMLTGVMDRSMAGPAPAFNFLRVLGRAFGRGRLVGVETTAEGVVRVTHEYPSMGAYLEALVQLRALEALVAEDTRGRANGD